MPAVSTCASYKPGDIILDGLEPVIICLKPDFRDIRCNNCFKNIDKETKCNKCRWSIYCSTQCQVEDWYNGHQVECKLWKSEAFRNFCNEGPNAVYKLLMVRSYALLKLKPEVLEKQYKLADGTSRALKDLPCFVGNSGMGKVQMEARGELAKYVNDLNSEDSDAQEMEAEVMFPWVGAFCTTVRDETDKDTIGVAIFMEISCMTNSCIPNVSFRNVGQKLQIRALAEIPAGEPLTMSRVMNSFSLPVRKEMLKERYDIDCLCKRCKAGPDSGFDYSKLNMMLDEMVAFEQAPPPRSEWIKVCEHHEVILKMLRQIYEEYDERITRQFRRAYLIAQSMGIPKLQLKKLREETIDHFCITYGKDHFFYKTFKIPSKDM